MHKGKMAASLFKVGEVFRGKKIMLNKYKYTLLASFCVTSERSNIQ